jgi:hypothetical protein
MHNLYELIEAVSEQLPGQNDRLVAAIVADMMENNMVKSARSTKRKNRRPTPLRPAGLGRRTWRSGTSSDQERAAS